MMKICNNDNIRFISCKKLKAKLNVEKGIDKKGDEEFREVVKGILKEIDRGVKKGLDLYQKMVGYALKVVLYDEKIEGKVVNDCQ